MCAVVRITNSAVDAKYAVVFAQLLIGEKNHGVHGFLVRIRSEDMQPMPNVRIEDMGCVHFSTFVVSQILSL